MHGFRTKGQIGYPPEDTGNKKSELKQVTNPLRDECTGKSVTLWTDTSSQVPCLGRGLSFGIGPVFALVSKCDLSRYWAERTRRDRAAEEVFS
jgi:hypothetical protein